MEARSSSKRPLDQKIQSQIEASMRPSQKKVRFDARNPSTLANREDDEGDIVLDLDEIGRAGNQTKRNAVKLDGYESDSSDDNFNVRADKKSREADYFKRVSRISHDEEQIDMFADLEDEVEGGDDHTELSVEAKRKKKEVKFLDEDDIEGQEPSSTSGGHVNVPLSSRQDKSVVFRRSRDESSDDTGEDEEEDDDVYDEELGAGAKKRHAPKLDAFNMRTEAQEGAFDAQGNFVRKAADPFAVYDTWLEGSTKADMKRAREAHQKREEEQRQRDLKEDAVSTLDVLERLISHLYNGETVLDCLARLTPKRSSRKERLRSTKAQSTSAMDIDHSDLDKEQDCLRKERVEDITGAADRLMTRGQSNVYDIERGLLIRQWQTEAGRTWPHESAEDDQQANDVGDNNNDLGVWHYRWSDARDYGEVHGPYDGPTMKAWKDAGFFSEGVEFKEGSSLQWLSTPIFD